MAVVAPILVLFDIDGTLIHTAGAGLRGMSAAFAALYGVAGALDGVPFAGRTDRAIVSDAFSRLGLPQTEERFVALRDAYLDELPAGFRTPRGG